MKKLAVAVALMFGVVGASEAGVYCKNEKGQTYEWHIGWERPAESANFSKEGNGNNGHQKPWFEHGLDRNVICFVNAETYRNLWLLRGLKYIQNMDTDAVAGRDGDGILYRGDEARFIIDNLPTVYGDYTTKAYYNDANP